MPISTHTLPRRPDIFKSAKGKYVTPVPIESRLSGNPLLEQICVMGSGLPAPVAVVVLSEAAKYIPREDIKTELPPFFGHLAC